MNGLKINAAPFFGLFNQLRYYQGKMKQYITYGIVFILGSGAGWLLSGTNWNEFFTSYVPSLATLVAAFYGAKFAFQFQQEKEEKENQEKHILNGNMAVFNLVRMANTLHVYRSQFIEPARGKPTAFLEIPPSLDLLEDDINFNVENLFFLHKSDSINLLGELTVEKSRFRGALDAINERSRMHRLEVQPAMEKAGFVQGDHYTLEKIKAILGPRLYYSIMSSTDQVIAHVDETIISLKSAGDRLSNVLKGIFPGERIISFVLKE